MIVKKYKLIVKGASGKTLISDNLDFIGFLSMINCAKDLQLKILGICKY
jgi:hypothetical protein